MRLIKSIEIRYLRSLYKIKLKNLGDLTIFSGANDVGKSNILKALNLFFNYETTYSEPLSFYYDFSIKRLNEVRRESVKGKQFIRIDIEFLRPTNFKGSLPPKFKVTKIWNREDYLPQETNDLELQYRQKKLPSSLEIARRMLSQFLNRVRYEYIPAIRDTEYYEYILNNLQESLISTQMKPNDPILKAVNELNKKVKEISKSLRTDFLKATNIKADVSIPDDPNSLFSAFNVSTDWGEKERSEKDIPSILLSYRGDGIQARYISSLLNYIAKNSSLFYIWGFEEPENSFEYNLSLELAKDFENEYSKNAQIFVTSHSPAFMSLRGENTISYRVYKNQNSTEIQQVHPIIKSDELTKLSTDIGIFKLYEEINQKFLDGRNSLLNSVEVLKKLNEEISKSKLPIVYVEGKNDQTILNVAWEKLHKGEQKNFEIKSCDPIALDKEGGAGGANTLLKLLSTVPADSPNIIIGIFDQDIEGVNSYKNLPKYFRDNQNLSIKISQNKRCASFLLPIPTGREEYYRLFNLYLEYYFSDDALKMKTKKGFGLEFQQPFIEKIVKMPGTPILEQEMSNFPETRKIIGGKTTFAEEIITTLPENEFKNFQLIFDKITEVIKFLE